MDAISFLQVSRVQHPGWLLLLYGRWRDVYATAASGSDSFVAAGGGRDRVEGRRKQVERDDEAHANNAATAADEEQ